jgi:hypothetical protein
MLAVIFVVFLIIQPKHCSSPEPPKKNGGEKEGPLIRGATQGLDSHYSE